MLGDHQTHEVQVRSAAAPSAKSTFPSLHLKVQLHAELYGTGAFFGPLIQTQRSAPARLDPDEVASPKMR